MGMIDMCDIAQYENTEEHLDFLVLLHNRQDIKRFLQHVGESLTNYKVVESENKIVYSGGCFRCFKIGDEVEKVRGLRCHAVIYPKDYLPPAELYTNLVGCKDNSSLHEIMEISLSVCGSGLDYKLK